DVDQAVEQARHAREPLARRAALERAVALASGRFLEGFYADWADELHVRERDRMEKILLELGTLCASMGDYDAALTHFRRALEHDEFRESSCLAVMECHVRVGNRRAAMVEYDRLRTLLRNELGVEPLPETDEAVRRLLSGGSVHGWPEPAAPTMPQHVAAQDITTSAQVRLKGRGEGLER